MAFAPLEGTAGSEVLRPYVDLGIIVPLKEEFRRLERRFQPLKQFVEGPIISSRLGLDSTGISSVAYLQDDMGKAAATRATHQLLESYDVGIIIVVGIAGGISSDVAVGDVCFSGTIIDVLENARVVDVPKKGQRQEFSSNFYVTDQLLTFSLSYMDIGRDVRPMYEDWQLTCFYSAKEKVPDEFIGRSDKNEIIGLPSIHDGSIVCGQVSKSNIYKGDLKGVDRKTLAIETESGGVFHTAQAAGVPAIAIRGVCDYADKNKSKLEEQTGGYFREIAADNAVSFLALQLTNPQFIRRVEARRASRGAREVFSTDDSQKHLSSLLSSVKETIHAQLSILAPEYKGKGRDYRLPLPRVKPPNAKATITPPSSRGAEPRSILQVIAGERLAVITTPRTYPDNSLPWVVAGELTHIELDGHQAFPILVPGEEVKPPDNDTFSRLLPDVRSLPSGGGFSVVFIIHEFALNSRSRVSFLKKALEDHPEARFLIVNRADSSIAGESELVLSTGAEVFDVCPVSFAEISAFLQRNFDYEDQEAGVLALRLKEMFDRFKLGAHPGYFAGIGADLLASLLSANRRAELLQLAVSGFLSFVVASDDSKVSLSRTAREEFLRRLVFRKRVEKRSYDRAALIALVEEFDDERDYGLDPIAFIKNFQDKSIIHFTEGNVEVSLPFIESYLLASELTRQPAAAAAYFDVSASNFDMLSFDIYAELGPSETLVERLLKMIDTQIEELRPDGAVPHILLSDEIRPKIVERQGKLQELNERLEKAFEDVLTNRPNREEKQQFLDLAARIEEGAKEAHDAARLAGPAPSPESSDPTDRLRVPFQVWGIAAIMLGSGSERLRRAEKRTLAAKLVTLTSILVNDILACFPRIAFDEMKEEVSSDPSIRSLFSISSGDPVDPTLKQLVETIVEGYELSILGFPLRSTLEHLGNTAGQAVLWRSVSQVESDDLVENLIARIWTSEIDAAEHRDDLLRSIKSLPPTPFLRVTLSTYFMTRVFWNHWETANRLALLDAADESMAGLGGRRIDKGRVQRMAGIAETKPSTSGKDGAKSGE